MPRNLSGGPAGRPVCRIWSALLIMRQLIETECESENYKLNSEYCEYNNKIIEPADT
jgi:hypothetical protein